MPGTTKDPTPQLEVHWTPGEISPSRKAGLLRVLFEDDCDADEQVAS
jgi:hypothetical protein